MIDPNVSSLLNQQPLYKAAQTANNVDQSQMDTIKLIQNCQLFCGQEAVVRSPQPCVLMPHCGTPKLPIGLAPQSSEPSAMVLQTQAAALTPVLPKSILFTNFATMYDRFMTGKSCPSMQVLEPYAPMIEELLTSRTLHPGIRFFDLLGLDIYDQWKKQGASVEDLKRFCGHCQKLSVVLLNRNKTQIQPKIISAYLGAFKSLQSKIPKELQPKFDFLLKVLSHPDQAIALGSPSVGLFRRDEVLGGKWTRREDVFALLDFAVQMYPKELQFISTVQDDLTLSRKLDELMIYRGSNDDVTITRYNFLMLLKRMVDDRFLKKEFPMRRLGYNIQTMDFNSKYKPWIMEMIKKYLYEDFFSDTQILAQNWGQKYQKYYVPPHHIYSGCFEVKTKCKCDKKLDNLQSAIITRLDQERKFCNADEYAAIFCEMIRLYQLVHDMYLLKDVFNDRLQGKNIPDAFMDRAFFPNSNDSKKCLELPLSNLSKQEVLEKMTTKPKARSPAKPRPVVPAPSAEPKQNPVPTLYQARSGIPTEVLLVKEPPVGVTEPTVVTEMTPQSLLPVSTPMEPREVPSQVRKVEAKTRPEDKRSREEKHAESTPPSEIERPDFPTKNVTGREVLRHLLDNGFVIQRTKGGHYQMEHVLTNVQTTVPFHESIKPGTLSSIRKAFYQSQGFED